MTFTICLDSIYLAKKLQNFLFFLNLHYEYVESEPNTVAYNFRVTVKNTYEQVSLIKFLDTRHIYTYFILIGVKANNG
jgi:hypothetical protein